MQNGRALASASLGYASLAAAAIVLSWARPSHATAPGGGDSTYVNYPVAPAVRRDGFAMGVTTGFGWTGVTGFPNKVASLSDPSAEVSVSGFGSSFSLWLGGALRDWLSFGLGISSGAAIGGAQLSSVPAAIVHVEAFPLFFQGGAFRDLGLSIEGGVGTGVILERDAPQNAEPLAAGGAMSFLGVAAFFEPLKLWHFSAGPSLSYSHAFSQSLSSHQVTLGFRVALYGVQPRPAKKHPPSPTARASSSSYFE